MRSDKKIKPVMTAKELVDLKINKIPMLVEGLMQKTGLIGLTGSSDVSKSTLLRQLGLTVAQGKSHFLGFKLNTNSQKVIYVSTEDLMTDLAFLLRKQLGNPKKADACLENMIFITTTYKIFKRLDKLMDEHNPDCVIIDCFTDIFPGDMNMTNKVREPLNKFKNLAQKHKSLFIVLNHVGKRAENNEPSKHNSLGSQGFEAKMRMLAELRLDRNDQNKRHLCIVKGNYIPNEQKNKSFVLEVDSSTLLLKNTGKRVDYSELGSTQRSTLRDKWYGTCYDLKEEDPERSVTDIYELLKDEGFDGSRSTVGNWLRDYNNN